MNNKEICVHVPVSKENYQVKFSCDKKDLKIIKHEKEKTHSFLTNSYDLDNKVIPQSIQYHGLSGTLLCYAKNPITNKKVMIRVLLDSGANSSLITRSLYRKLDLHGEKISLQMNVAGNQLIHSNQMETSIILSTLDHSFSTDCLLVTTIEQIGKPFAPILINANSYKHLRDINFTETYPIKVERPFDLLLSEPYYSSIMMPGQRLSSNLAEPVAKETKLGWVLRGATGIKNTKYNVYLYNDKAALTYEQSMIYAKNMETFDFSKFWTTENVGISPNESDIKTQSAQEIQAETLQRNTAIYDPINKKWSCELLWKDENTKNHILSDNYRRALAMMKQVHSKVKKEHQEMVNKSMMEILENNWSEKVPEQEINRDDHPTYVLTSRPVIDISRKTTKCRIIINASQPDPKTKMTLNKMLLQGPNFLPQIMEVILILRQYKYVFTIDVSKMFFSVELKKESDRDTLRYLWSNFNDEKPTLYRFKVLPFGCVSSPYQAMWCLHETARKFEKQFPEASKVLLNYLYMDDIATGSDNLAQAQKLAKEILFIMNEAGYFGHKMTANDPRILKNVDEKHKDESEDIKILGLKLKHSTNTFHFDLDNKFTKFQVDSEIITRRMIVSLASQIFDTQGFTEPFKMKFKRILPLLWHGKTGWDQNLKEKTIENEMKEIVPDPIATEAIRTFESDPFHCNLW
jgi:hypothetical protein